jgi:hypothetical protein
MSATSDSTPEVTSVPTPDRQLVSLYVEQHHPLLPLKQALDWEALTQVMVKHWRAAGKNVDGGPGQPWPVSLYVPLLVLKAHQQWNSRQAEQELAENLVARVFIGWQEQLAPQVRDHANIARAEEALGAAGMEELNQLLVSRAVQFEFASEELVSSDTTVQELPIGYPNEPGILRGTRERCQRALVKLQRCATTASAAVERGIAQTKEVLKSVKHHHLFAKGQAEKTEVLRLICRQTEELIATGKEIRAEVGAVSLATAQSALSVLKKMGEVCAVLLPQIRHWITTGVVAKGKLIHAGITEARAIVKGKAGKRVEFGLKWLIHRLGGGYLFGQRVEAYADERKMPLCALAAYRALFGPTATPEMMVYDRGGSHRATVNKLRKAGVKKVGIEPKGKTPWSVAEADQRVVKSERGKTEGSIGTLKSNKYHFNQPQERSLQTIERAGQRAFVSLNLNKLMRDLVAREKKAQGAVA